jgi:tetratricopeptide (TPR) repeat protein
MYWNTLGVAHYRLGKWQLAVEALQRSIEVKRQAGVYDLYFLAMSYAKLGDRDKARACYDQADARWKSRRPAGPVCVRRVGRGCKCHAR